MNERSTKTTDRDADLDVAIRDWVVWAYAKQPTHEQLTTLFHAVTDKAEEMFDATFNSPRAPWPTREQLVEWGYLDSFVGMCRQCNQPARWSVHSKRVICSCAPEDAINVE